MLGVRHGTNKQHVGWVAGKFTPGFGTVGVNFPANSEIKVDFDWGLSRSVGFLRKGILRIGKEPFGLERDALGMIRLRRELSRTTDLANPAIMPIRRIPLERHPLWDNHNPQSSITIKNNNLHSFSISQCVDLKPVQSGGKTVEWKG
jgi:hypothetical protein